MFWWPSRLAAKHFLERIAPRLKAACPSVRLLVGGWRAREVLGPYIRDNDVTVLDNFADPREAFSRLSVLVYAPPVGTGMKIKVLEAMAYGVPVVANSEGYEGLEADPAPPVRLAQTDDEIVDSTLELLRDAGVRRRAILEGMECVRRSFSPEPVTRALASFLEEKVT
jgi:glycosyltransferase involved in cell wall biosynthesis